MNKPEEGMQKAREMMQGLHKRTGICAARKGAGATTVGEKENIEIRAYFKQGVLLSLCMYLFRV